MKEFRLHHRFGRLVFLALLLATFNLAGFAQFVAPAPSTSPGLNVPRQVTTDPAILYPSNREILMMPGDQLGVSIFGTNPAFNAAPTVALDGTIRLPLAGTLSVGGLSVIETEAVIAKRMEDLKQYNNPQVAIQMILSPGHIVTVLGADHAVVPILSSKRLFDVMAAAGGFSLVASPLVTIDRPGVLDPIVIDIGNDPAHSAAANVPIFAGDTITIGEVGNYYVIGAVKLPGMHPLSGTLPTTVMQAISLSTGTTYIAKADSTRLIRTVGSERSVTTIPLKKIMKGEAPDPVLAADDIIFVPTSHIKEIFSLAVVTTVFALVFTGISVARY